MTTQRPLAMILAGGKGSRLGPLTCHRAKPAVPFGGRYRIIDFVLSNFVNSDYRRIYVLTQYMASSLIKHLQRNWHISGPDSFVEIVPAQMRMGTFWYRGTADAVTQNLNLVEDSKADLVAIFGGDHIYKMDLGPMEDFHRDNGAALTIAAFPVPIEEAHRYGVLRVDHRGRVIGFQEKPSNPEPLPDDPDTCLVSMGNYLFDKAVLSDALNRDSEDESSSHDFGKDVIPALRDAGAPIFAYDFGGNRVPGEPDGMPAYWRDVGTLDSFFEANMDVRSRLPVLNLYNRGWRIRTAQRDYPPARIVQGVTGQPAFIVDSLICEGSIISAGRLSESLIGYDCFLHGSSDVENSVLFAGCDIGAGAMLRGVLADKNCKIDPGARIGLDPEFDRQRFPWISDKGIIVLPKGTHVPAQGPIELARDMQFMLRNDAQVAADIDATPMGVSYSDETARHSYVSAGPRYRRFGVDHSSSTQ
jgi:glucose-1-phosphate adenylyltransferase